MNDPVWRCPRCPREIDLSDSAGAFAKNSHQKSHDTMSPSPRHAKPKGRSRGLGDFIEDLIEGFLP